MGRQVIPPGSNFTKEELLNQLNSSLSNAVSSGSFAKSFAEAAASRNLSVGNLSFEGLSTKSIPIRVNAPTAVPTSSAPSSRPTAVPTISHAPTAYVSTVTPTSSRPTSVPSTSSPTRFDHTWATWIDMWLKNSTVQFVIYFMIFMIIASSVFSIALFFEKQIKRIVRRKWKKFEKHILTPTYKAIRKRAKKLIRFLLTKLGVKRDSKYLDKLAEKKRKKLREK